MQNKNLLLLLFSTLLAVFSLQAQTIAPDFTGTDGVVNAMVKSGNTLYIGGTFNFVGRQAAGGAVMNQNNGSVTPFSHVPNGVVDNTVPDGNGGLFISGSFSTVDNLPRSRFAYIKADGTLAALSPVFNAGESVISLVPNGNTIYFSLIDAGNNNRIAAYNLTNGSLIWQFYVAGKINKLVFLANTLYLGGNFTGIRGSNRNYLAAVDGITGSVTAWNPNADGIVTSLIATGTAIYASGSFSKVGGLSRTIAAIDPFTGSVMNWNPIVTESPSLLATDNKNVYAGAKVSSNSARVYALDTLTGSTLWTNSLYQETQIETLTGIWGPTINALAAAGGKVFVGGLFCKSAYSAANDDFVAYDAATGAVQPLSFKFNYGGVSSIGVVDNRVYAWGSFKLIDASFQRKIAALDATTGALKAWDATVGGGVFHPYVKTLTLSGNILYAGGQFGGAGGQSRNNLAAIDTTSALATAWDPVVLPAAFNNSFVNSISISGTTVYVAGTFSSIGGVTRNGLAAIDAATGVATNWNPNPNYGPLAVQATPNTIYVGGAFFTIGGASRNGLAAIDAATGLATAWNPSGNGAYGLALSGNTLFVPRYTGPALYAINLTTGANKTLASGTFYSVAAEKNVVYAGGVDKIISVDTTAGSLLWQKPTDGYVYSILPNETNVYMGGGFTAVAGSPRLSLAVFNLTVSAPLPITLYSFTAVKEGPNASLTWVASTEAKEEGFEIENSLDGINFIKLARMDATATGMNSYQFTHYTPRPGTNYYRLKMINADGKVSYSPIRKIKFDAPAMTIVLHTNPFTSRLDFTVISASTKNAFLLVTDIGGKIVYTLSKMLYTGANNFSVDLSAQSKGLYIVKITADDQYAEAKVLKQ